MKRIPSLDGLRAISIALVIVGHQYQAIFHDNPRPYFWNIVGDGHLGVEIFFVISGFLITMLLLQEHDKYGSISLRNFYVRRLCRIFPALYAYVAVLGLLTVSGALAITKVQFLSALTFTWNYSPWANAWTLNHTWSLSVEEQFYLLWPSALFLLLARKSRRGAAIFAGALILAAPFLRLATHFLSHSFMQGHIYYMSHTRMDALMFGCLAALLHGTEFLERVCKVTARYVGAMAVFIFVVSVQLSDKVGGAYIYVVGYTLEGLFIALIMLYVIRNHDSAVGRLLNWGPVVHVGVLSYSLYLWQGLFLHAENNITPSQPPYSLLCVFLAAELSYNVIEKPFLRLKSKFETKRVPLQALAAEAASD